ncbi:MAG TPA: DUF6519 domain-containing protein [Jatrophihabitans sp.]|jgi:hypothetical protein|uniref:DUF6519 domain-containing protein n=1 Tax=Jatrophihabitans sp. TaxID=1932789 RepID=UPI002F1AD1DD
MATDVARLSFDPARTYRGVVPQQGRVSLEAEQNEQRVLDSEERRLELLDIVGPAGTPDNGYAVSGEPGWEGKGFEITVGAGTMYVGGWRLELDQDLGDYDQPDWLDRGRGWKETGREHVMLLVADTDVTAVEDPALYEVALGGPDGAARTRLLQRIVRQDTEGATCAEAMAEDRERWRRQGLTFDPATMALESNSRLLVTWKGDPEPADPCEPSSTGGYLGAENQLVRVQIVRTGRDGSLDLVWGYDDASSLYRVTADASANPVLTLDRTPVDDYHRPRAGQAVQALRATAELRATDGVVEGYVAALGGRVGVLTAPYDPDTKTVQFPAPLPADYTDPEENPQLYLRIWEELLTGVELGKPVSLTGTGMRITITTEDERGPHVDDFWCIGVRPSTPTAVYPERYLRTPQPPDGPHQWICPLAVIEWVDKPEQPTQLVVLEDCRRHFSPLTEGDSDGCCTIEVHPSDAASGRLQALIERAAAGRRPAHRDSRVTICFAPGRYELREPLILRRRHSNMTLRGCSEAAVIAAHPDAIEAFGNGLVVLADVDNVTVTGLEFVLPQVPSALAKVQSSTGSLFDRAAARAINDAGAGRYLSLGIRAVECAVLEITDCLFRFSLGEHETTPEVEQTMPRSVLGVAVFLSGGSWGLRVLDNRFLHHASAPVEDRELTRLLVGLLHVPSAAAGMLGAKRLGRLGSAQLPALIEDALISDNVFDGVTVAAMILAQVGSVRVQDNVIRNVNQGLMIVDALDSSDTDFDGEHEIESGSERVRQLHASLASGLLDPVLAQLLVFGATLPLPDLPGFEPAGVRIVDLDNLDALRAEAAESQRARTARTVARLSAEHPTSPEATDAPDDAPDVPDAKAARRARTARNAEAGADEPATRGLTIKAADLARSIGLSTGMLSAVRRLAEFSKAAGANSTLTAAITVEHNSIDCTVPHNGRTGWALYLTMQRNEAFGPSATVTSNRLTSERASVIVGIGGLEAGTVTGNIVGTRSGRTTGAALALGDVGDVAITGNVVFGGAILPANRPFPAPLDTWLPFNTIA